MLPEHRQRRRDAVGSHVAGCVCAVRDRPAAVHVAHGEHARVVAVEAGRPVGTEGADELRLLALHSVDAPEGLDVHAAHDGDHGNRGGEVVAQLLKVAGEPGAHLQHELCLGGEVVVEDEEREAERGVLIALGGDDVERLAEHGEHGHLRRRLAHRAGDRHDVRADAPHLLARLFDEVVDRPLDADDLDVRRHVDSDFGDDGRRAFLDGLRDEGVAVVCLAPDGDVGVAGLQRARVCRVRHQWVVLSRALRAWRSRASWMRVSTSSPMGSPVCAHITGNMLRSVKPGIVLISLM